MPKSKRTILYGTITSLAAGNVDVDTGSGTTRNTPCMVPGYQHAGASALMVTPDGDPNGATTIGIAGIKWP